MTFKCGGWLHISLNDLSDIAFVKIDHHDDHVPYFPIDIPPDVEEYVRANTNMTPTQVSFSVHTLVEVTLLIDAPQLWQKILETHPKPPFTRQAIYSLWSAITSKAWKRDPDEIKSAKILLEEAKKSNKPGLYTVESITLKEEPGVLALAFALPDILRQFGGRIREVALDSACEPFLLL